MLFYLLFLLSRAAFAAGPGSTPVPTAQPSSHCMEMAVEQAVGQTLPIRPNGLAPEEYKEEFRSELLKKYLYLNLALPQHNSSIVSGLAAFVLSKGINPDEMGAFAAFSDSEWLTIWTDMSRAHAAHGITTQVSMDRMKQVLNPFVTRMVPAAVSRVLRLAALPNELPRGEPGMDTSEIAMLQRRFFFSDPSLAENRSKLAAYATSILQTMKSPEMREVSKELRHSAMSNRIPAEAMTQARKKIRQLIVSALKADHPELAEPLPEFLKDIPRLARKSPWPGYTRADALYDSLTGQFWL